MKNLRIIFCLALLCFGGSRVSASNGSHPTYITFDPGYEILKVH